jgi:peroxiredoxin
VSNYPWYRGWHEKYSTKGVTVVGIHSPETQEEADLDRVRRKAKEHNLTYPIAIDNDFKTWKAWGNRYWPSTYLVDKKGRVRYRWDGELNWQGTKGEEIMRRKIEQLLAEKD